MHTIGWCSHYPVDAFREALSAALRLRLMGYTPREAGEMCMYLEGNWNTIRPRQQPDVDDPVAQLDVSILQQQVLAPSWGSKIERATILTLLGVLKARKS